jgi:hypothetical protein
MRNRWLLPMAVALPLHLFALDPPVKARVTAVTINPGEITPLHLRPNFESVIHMPEEVTSVILGSPGLFKAEHNEAEPDYVYVKPITKEKAESNLLIATQSGQHVELELISDDSQDADPPAPVDFLVEYHSSRNSLITVIASPNGVADSDSRNSAPQTEASSLIPPLSAIDLDFEQQARINAPAWTKWEGKQIETSLGDIRQLGNQIMVAFSILNSSALPVEITPPQIEISGRLIKKKKKKERDITSDQLRVQDYRLSTTRLEPGSRADSVVVFDRPSFKQSTEKLFLQIAQADQVDHPVLIALPFTPPIAEPVRQKENP